MKSAIVVICAALLLTAGLSAPARAQQDTGKSPIEKIGDDLFQLGTVRIDARNRVITVPGKVNMEKGMIELIACSPGGKVHESVLVLDVVPYHLQVSLLLLGLNYIGGLQVEGDTATPKGDLVDVTVSWKDAGGTETTVRAEELAWDIPRNGPMQKTPWVFAGSRMENGRYMADIDKSLITTYHNPFTILDNPLSTGRDDEVYKVNERIMPPKGTPVTVTIRPAPAKQ